MATTPTLKKYYITIFTLLTVSLIVTFEFAVSNLAYANENSMMTTSAGTSATPNSLQVTPSDISQQGTNTDIEVMAVTALAKTGSFIPQLSNILFILGLAFLGLTRLSYGKKRR